MRIRHAVTGMPHAERLDSRYNRFEAIEAVHRNRDHSHQRPALLGHVTLEQRAQSRIDSKQPVDLRRYVQRHGGKFPSRDWLVVVFTDPVRNTHGVVWQKIRSDEGGATAEGQTVAAGIVAAIADYVVSVQAK